MTGRRPHGGISPIGLFLTEEDAEETRALLASEAEDCLVEPLPIAL
ncbi:hypothetical protein [Spirillospora sp. NPDC029432]